MLKKVSISIFLLIFIFSFTFILPVNGTAVPRNGSGFSDVSKEHYAYAAINWMVENGIIEGTGNNQFSPARDVTRAEFAKMMVLTLELDLINPSKESFLDIKKGGWQYKYVESAKPYMTGFRTSLGDYFRPSQNAEREDMAVALVLAMGFGDEMPDMNVLSQYSDSDDISPNLKKYVAIAVKHGLMQGYDRNGSRVFAPSESLNRASAAELLYNAFRENEEKVTYEDEKVTYENSAGANNGNAANEDYEADEDDDAYEDDEADEDADGHSSSTIAVSVSGDKLLISWDRISSSNFSGYKVVISKSDSTPVYPEDGYLKFITDRNDTSITVKAGDKYNGGDFGGKLKSGGTYYFSITVLYKDGRSSGNVVRATLP